ncbi:uncharacterized protein PAC_09335 [Phialocephala subalpina]|uniref:Uncharacterized protein n=1 Tax=Phialocephala subalpina TaxID=576137 RepID=A0A1L7X349_9HELO|nr:uncharacterized protein PAC_09335 [Phialocephala subalpina]
MSGFSKSTLLLENILGAVHDVRSKLGSNDQKADRVRGSTSTDKAESTKKEAAKVESGKSTSDLRPAELERIEKIAAKKKLDPTDDAFEIPQYDEVALSDEFNRGAGGQHKTRKGNNGLVADFDQRLRHARGYFCVIDSRTERRVEDVVEIKRDKKGRLLPLLRIWEKMDQAGVKLQIHDTEGRLLPLSDIYETMRGEDLFSQYSEAEMLFRVPQDSEAEMLEISQDSEAEMLFKVSQDWEAEMLFKVSQDSEAEMLEVSQDSKAEMLEEPEAKNPNSKKRGELSSVYYDKAMTFPQHGRYSFGEQPQSDVTYDDPIDKFKPQNLLRIILCQGLSSVNKKPETFPHENMYSPPYFRSGKGPKQLKLQQHIKRHLECKRWESTRVYKNERLNGFHVTFYQLLPEVPDSSTPPTYGNWKTGEFYRVEPSGNDRPRKGIRECAYTLESVKGDRQGGGHSGHIDLWDGSEASPPEYVSLENEPDNLTVVNEGTEDKEQDEYEDGEGGTIVLLSPSKFHDPKLSELAIASDGKSTTFAELSVISFVLKALVKQWEDLADEIDEIVDEKGSFIKADEFVKGLGDDTTMSRSERYYWAIECLHRFDESIGDNILQWKLYRESRFASLVSRYESRDKLHPVVLADRDARTRCDRLSLLRFRFREKLDTVHLLRDGLFRATTLQESKKTTRLTENVSLLTYVSIFFMPLAFCTSLWSITDILPKSRLAIVAPIFAVTTYIIVITLSKRDNIKNILGISGDSPSETQRSGGDGGGSAEGGLPASVDLSPKLGKVPQPTDSPTDASQYYQEPKVNDWLAKMDPTLVPKGISPVISSAEIQNVLPNKATEPTDLTLSYEAKKQPDTKGTPIREEPTEPSKGWHSTFVRGLRDFLGLGGVKGNSLSNV